MAQLYKNSIQSYGDDRYLKLDASNDPVTNEVNITPSSDAHSLNLQKDARIKAGEKMIFDGA